MTQVQMHSDRGDRDPSGFPADTAPDPMAMDIALVGQIAALKSSRAPDMGTEMPDMLTAVIVAPMARAALKAGKNPLGNLLANLTASLTENLMARVNSVARKKPEPIKMLLRNQRVAKSTASDQ